MSEMNIEDIYQKKRITAQEVYDSNKPEERQATIKGFEVATRTYKDEEYKYIKLTVLMNGKERTIDLKQHNADEIGRVAGKNPNNWGGVVLQLQATKDGGSDFPKLFVFVSQSQPQRQQDLGIEFV